MSTTTDQIAVQYPIPTYRFAVSVGDEKMCFQSVSGLDISHDTIEYRDGGGNWLLMPGQRHRPTITLKRGVFKGQSKLYDWINSISLNQVEKKDISISLTDETGSNLLITWNISNAFPEKLTAPSFDATSNEVAVQEMSLKADRVTVQFH
jgi:phage tail-like protein